MVVFVKETGDGVLEIAVISIEDDVEAVKVDLEDALELVAVDEKI